MSTITKNKKRILQDTGMKSVLEANKNEYCDFNAVDNDGFKRRVFYASTLGLDWPENSHCHVGLQLYYETHRAMDIPFATHKDAWDYVHSQGKIDNRIIEKKAHPHCGWLIKTKNRI